MTVQRAAAQPYTTSFEATIERVDGRDVVLEETYFYAESGGQPADRGRMGDRSVVDVQVDDDVVVHTLDEPPTFDAGRSVLCRVDWRRRMYCMRAHTASHVLYGAARTCMDDLGYGGFDIRAAADRSSAEAVGWSGGVDGSEGVDSSDADRVRVDFVTSTDVDDDVLVTLERRANQAVWESRDVTWETLSADAARDRDGIVFNEKTEEGVFGEDAEVRVVTVGGAEVAAGQPSGQPFDVAACGGTHVRNTREIGPITVLGRSNPGEGMTRVEFAVGPRGIERRGSEKAALLAAGRALDVGPGEVPEAVSRLQDEVTSLREEAADAQRRALEARLAQFPVVERQGERWLVGTVEGVDANDVEPVARAVAGDRAPVVVLVGRAGSTFVVVAAGESASSNAGAVVERVTDEFGGGGGGSPRFAQGGGLSVDPAGVVEWFRES
ncbi:alanine--tRNA ligase-related protein [Halorubellus salinus]|uniref:alanine--tRNA ligase-related protein n=1 Tax=Halorubellus salinus TaxID=755309 RepID=UPI001D070CDE|nr:DHHA1 domain-containing protein [Halorubellus salinus]